MEDQLLRAKGVGNDRLSNPHAYAFRKQYGRAYFQFKPDSCLWILVIIIRKLFIAITAVVFNKNASFQMAACLLVMFLAYSAQMMGRPYMSPGDFEDTLKAHTEASYTSAIHARLRAVISNIETRGRKKARKNLMNFEGKIDRSAIFGILSGWLFNYNTVEQLMIFSAVLVCLMGIMYQSSELTYTSSRDSITGVVMFVIIAAIVYFFTVLITEIVVLYNEGHRAEQLAKSARAGSKAVKKGGDGDGKASPSVGSGRGRLVGDDGDIMTGKMDTHMNPLFMNAKGDGNALGATASVGLDAIVAQKTSPPTEMWLVVQQGYVELSKQLDAANAQLADAKREVQMTALAASADLEESADRVGSGRKKAFAPKGTGAGEGGAAAAKAKFAGFRAGAAPSLKAARKAFAAAEAPVSDAPAEE
jgi:hypothetical protein